MRCRQSDRDLFDAVPMARRNDNSMLASPCWTDSPLSSTPPSASTERSSQHGAIETQSRELVAALIASAVIAPLEVQGRAELAGLVKAVPLVIAETMPIDRAISSAGGIALTMGRPRPWATCCRRGSAPQSPRRAAHWLGWSVRNASAARSRRSLEWGADHLDVHRAIRALAVEDVAVARCRDRRGPLHLLG